MTSLAQRIPTARASRSWTALAANWQVFAVIYAGVWVLTLLAAAAGAILPALASIAPELQLYPHAHPSLDSAALVFLHNAQVAGWPLLFAWLNLRNDAWQQRLVSILLPGFLLINTALVGAAIATSGTAILPYLVHLPVEWAAVAVTATGWLLTAAGTLDRRQLAALTGCFLALLALAAGLEIYAVPHL